MDNTTPTRYRYGRTFHAPNSPGLQSDDKRHPNMKRFIGEEMVFSIKKDGGNSAIYFDGYTHARSPDSGYNWTHTYLRRIAEVICHELPEGYRLSLENMYAKHSIYYPEGSLEGYLYLLSVWNETQCLSYDDTVEWAQLLDLPMPEVLYRGPYYMGLEDELASKLDLTKEEGIVGRLVKSYSMAEMSDCIVKWVRAGHVQTDEHWLKTAYPNGKPKQPSKPSWCFQTDVR
jgi:hypothetical protein